MIQLLFKMVEHLDVCSFWIFFCFRAVQTGCVKRSRITKFNACINRGQLENSLSYLLRITQV